MATTKLTTMDRFLSHVAFEPMSGCWLWTASLTKDGYGQMSFYDAELYKEKGALSRIEIAHRVAWELFVGAIPEGTEIDHKCKTRCCVNYRHLEPVTHAENIARGRSGRPQAERTHCKRGHPYAGDNLSETTKIVKGKKYTGRVCLTCARENTAKWRSSNRPPLAVA